MENTNPSTPSLSNRGRKLATTPARVDFDLFMEAAADPYHPIENPKGKFVLNVAENSLMLPVIKKKVDTITKEKPIPEWVFKYTHPLGHPEVREVVAHFLTKHLCKCPISPEAIGFAAGAAAIVEVTSFILSDTGDVVVIPAPAYPVYTADLGIKSGMERYDLHTHFHPSDIGSSAPVTPEDLDKAWNDLKVQGKNFRLLLITSPDNPTGCIYQKSQLRELAEWCISHKVHMVVNEIYGLSLVDTEDQAIQQHYQGTSGFSSFAGIMAEKHSDYLHWWYALSKDFAMSGMRFGMVHSLNQALMNALANVNVPHMVSNLAQWVVGELFQEGQFIEDYIVKNKQQVTESFKAIASILDSAGVPYVPARGSLFLWADFSKFLKANTQEAEDQLWEDIFKQTGVLITPGRGFQHQKYGLFRIVHTAVPTDHLQVAIGRIEGYLKRLANS